MGAPQKFKGRYRFANEETLTNAKEILMRAIADDMRIIAEAFVFADLEVAITYDNVISASYYEPMTVVIAEMSAHALSGSVHCVYGSGREKEETRIRASGTRTATALPALPPRPTNEVEKVLDALNRGKLGSLGMTPAQIGAALWSALRNGKAEHYYLLSSGDYVANEDAFNVEDLLVALHVHAEHMANWKPAELWGLWPDTLERYFVMRLSEAERIKEGTRDLAPIVRRLIDWALARHGKLGDLPLDPELLPYLASRWLTATSYAGWDRVYPRTEWNRAVIEGVLRADRIELMSELQKNFDGVTVEEEVTLRGLTPSNGLDNAIEALEKLGDAAVPFIEREAEKLLPLLDDPERAHTKMEESRDNHAAWTMHARCTHYAIALLRARRRAGRVLEERFDPLLVRSFQGMISIDSYDDEHKARNLWFDAVRSLPEERRIRIYTSAGNTIWFYLQEDPIPALARDMIRAVVSLPTEIAIAGYGDKDLVGYRVATLGPAYIPLILEALKTKGAKHREALAASLIHIDGAEAESALESLRNDKGKKVRELVEKTLTARKEWRASQQS